MAFLVCASCIYASGKETRHRRAVDPEYLRVTVRSEATVRIRDGRLDLKRVQRELFERPMMAPSRRIIWEQRCGVVPSNRPHKGRTIVAPRPDMVAKFGRR